MPKGMFAQDHVLAIARETHIRDLASRILAGRLAARTGLKPDDVYHAALSEAETSLDGDY